MEFRTLYSVKQFNTIYENRLKKPSCLPICMEELCAGWTTETLRQIFSKVSLMSNISMPLFYLSPDELGIYSNKAFALTEVFKLFDTRGLSRIDGMELVCCMVMVSSGEFLKKLEACFYVFSMNEEAKLNRSQFCFFLDSYFRGLGKIILIESDTFYPRTPNIRMRPEEIENYADSIFKSSDSKISSQDFLIVLSQDEHFHKAFALYPQEFQKAQEKYRDLITSRLKLIPFIKSLIYNHLSTIQFT